MSKTWNSLLVHPVEKSGSALFVAKEDLVKFCKKQAEQKKWAIPKSTPTRPEDITTVVHVQGLIQWIIDEATRGWHGHLHVYLCMLI